MSYTNKQFFDCIKAAVIADAKRSGILASLTAAQAFIESGSGNSKLAQQPNNNLFGIKGEYNGQYVTMKTQEWNGTGYYTVNAKFRKYPSWNESIKDHNDFLLKNSRYKNLIGVKDYKLACQLIHQDGYATSPVYSDSLIKCIEKFSLYEWDLQTPFVPYAGTITATWLKVREGAGQHYPVVLNRSGEEFQLEQGTCVAIYDEAGNWCRINPTRNRWVSKDYVKKG